jgi:hypothetical protein
MKRNHLLWKHTWQQCARNTNDSLTVKFRLHFVAVSMRNRYCTTHCTHTTIHSGLLRPTTLTASLKSALVWCSPRRAGWLMQECQRDSNEVAAQTKRDSQDAHAKSRKRTKVKESWTNGIMTNGIRQSTTEQPYNTSRLFHRTFFIQFSLNAVVYDSVAFPPLEMPDNEMF